MNESYSLVNKTVLKVLVMMGILSIGSDIVVGVDANPLREYYSKIIQLGALISSQIYFDYDHTKVDVFETVNKRELELGVTAMATMIYLMDKNL